MIKYIFANCGAKVLIFCKSAKYFSYFCRQIQIADEKEVISLDGTLLRIHRRVPPCT